MSFDMAVAVSSEEEESELAELEALSLINTAFIMAGEALTAPKLRPEERLATLMECHGSMLAALGPGVSLPFGEFRAKLRGPLRDLLPTWVSAEGLEDLTVLDADGCITEDAFDLRWETAELLKLIQKLRDFSGRRVTTMEVKDHIAQSEIFEVISGRGPQLYVQNRASLITSPAGTVEELSALGLPLKALSFYADISYQSRYRGWWFPCPVCRWPMKVTERRTGKLGHGKAECFYPRHAETGASYIFRLTDAAPTLEPAGDPPGPSRREARLHLSATGHIPQARPVEGCKALVRGVWRYTTVPGLPELRLHQELTRSLQGTGAEVHLWPRKDAYDHLVKIPGPEGEPLEFTADLKDYTYPHTLGRMIHRAGGDRGGAKWLVVPDHRANQVPLLSEVCAQYGMKAVTATDFAVMVCEAAGVQWV